VTIGSTIGAGSDAGGGVRTVGAGSSPDGWGVRFTTVVGGRGDAPTRSPHTAHASARVGVKDLQTGHMIMTDYPGRFSARSGRAGRAGA
jgi:hypothetical protein